ncbi:MAG: DUF2461 domain-containing protein [Muribaculaceae bacterium]|nr:DUF2461 domain-containing protein [Muribaculaceae bacterium]
MMNTKEIYGFLKDIARHNDREWFAANKERYQWVKAQVDELTRELIARVAVVDPRAAMLSVADCTYRIYRDTRFSQDKTPYKTHIGIFVNPPFGKKGDTAGYYLHIEPGNTGFYVGSYCLPAELLKELRNEIYANIDEYLEIVEDPAFRALYHEIGDDPLKTAPKGFPKDWPYIDYLKPRHFGVYAKLSDDFLDNGLDVLMPYIEQGARYNRFCNYTLDPSEC